jgi:hypothetical protein
VPPPYGHCLTLQAKQLLSSFWKKKEEAKAVKQHGNATPKSTTAYGPSNPRKWQGKRAISGLV